MALGVEVDLRLLQIDKLPRLGGSERDDDRQSLGHAESDVGDIDEIFRASPPWVRKTTHFNLDPGCVDSLRLHLPREAQPLQVRP